MEKRLFNKLGFETSLLGLGCCSVAFEIRKNCI